MPQPLLNPKQPIDWYLDWDGTITKKDTLDALVNIAAKTKPDVDVPRLWKGLGQAYYDDYIALHSEQMKHSPTTLEGEKRFLEIIEAAEIRSVDRVSDSGIFSGLVTAGISQGAAQALENNEVEIRPGFSEFCRNMVSRRSDQNQENLTILSVNWSACFIEECLRAAKLGSDPKETQLKICANELENISPNLDSLPHPNNQGSPPSTKTTSEPNQTPSTGRIVPGPGMQSRIIFSRDKLERFSKSRTPSSRVTAAPKVYIGDSWTDLECLLAADLGICIRDDPMTGTQQKLADSLRRLGIECRRLRDLLDCSDPETDGWGVVWARDFGEVNEWIIGDGK